MTEPYYADDAVTLYAGDCLDVLSTLPDNSVDAVVTDPPYGLEFMGKEWDSFKTSAVGNPNMAAKRRMDNAPEPESGNPWASERKSYGAVRKVARCLKCGKQKFNHENSRCHCAEPLWDYGQRESMRSFQQWCQLWAAECLRVLKPGGHLLAFGGTRTWHRLAVAIEDAGFEIRDTIAWLYGSGFPKSLDVSKAIDRAAGAEREVVGQKTRPYTAPREGMLTRKGRSESGYRPDGAPSVMERADERGYAVSDITAPATADAQRWQGWGTALKPAHEPICVARKPLVGTVAANVLAHGTGALNIDGCRIGYASSADLESVRQGVEGGYRQSQQGTTFMASEGSGRTVNITGRWPANVALDETAAAALDQRGELNRGATTGRSIGGDSAYGTAEPQTAIAGYGDAGGASRFYFTAKAGSDERITHDGIAHPTVKPLSLMRWLVRLVTPPGGVILEPFAGSGTTVEAALLEGFRCIAIEREADYLPLITQRINRRLDPVAYLTAAGEDLGLFDFSEPA